MRLDSDVKEIKGIGEKSAAAFAKAGVYTVGDLLRYFPRGYEQYFPPVPFEKLQEEEAQAVAAFVTKTPDVVKAGRYQITTTTLHENEHSLQVTWFNMPFLRKTLKRGFLYVFYGHVIKKGNRFCMEQPKIFTPAEYQELEGHKLPVYPLVSGLTNKMISKALRQVMEAIPTFPDSFRRSFAGNTGWQSIIMRFPTFIFRFRRLHF